MQNILSEKQKLLIDYLTVTGCEKAAVLLMVADLWEDEATEEMLAYCASNLNASRAQLLKVSSEISSKFKRQSVKSDLASLGVEKVKETAGKSKGCGF